MVVALLLAALPATATLRSDFRVRVGETPGPGPPLFSEGRAWFVDAEGRVHAVDSVTGKEVWEAPVRCGHDAFLLHRGHLACASAVHARVLVLSARDGKLLARETLDGGPYRVTAVAGTLVFHDVGVGRLIGYDVARRTWAFDHGTEADPGSAAEYAPLVLGSRYLFTEEEHRTLRAIDVADGRLHLVARSATPVRIDGGRAARITHGLLLSHGAHAVQAFDIAGARRAWRLDVDRLTGVADARVVAVSSDADRVVVLVEAPETAHPTGAVAARWPLVLVAGLRSGDLQATRSLAWDVPAGALPALLAAQDDRCDVASLAAPVLAGARPVLSITARCGPRRTRFPNGVVVGLPAAGATAGPDARPWVTAPSTADRLVFSDGALYGLWGREGVPHGERVVVELDPQTGAERARALLGYTPTWVRVEGEQLWVGTSAGTVVVFAR